MYNCIGTMQFMSVNHCPIRPRLKAAAAEDYSSLQN